MIEYFHHPDPYISVKAGTLLINLTLDRPDALELVRSKMNDADAWIANGNEDQKRIVMRLAWIASIQLTPRGLEAIDRNMYGSDVETQTTAIEALGFLRPVSSFAVEALLARMDFRSDSSFIPRLIRALGDTRCACEQVIERLARELGSNNDYVKRAAAEALGKMGEPARRRSEPVLRRLLADPATSEFTKDAARLAMGRMKGTFAVPPPGRN